MSLQINLELTAHREAREYWKTLHEAFDETDMARHSFPETNRFMLRVDSVEIEPSANGCVAKLQKGDDVVEMTINKWVGSFSIYDPYS
jgi:RNA binding exosome subunit